ncbi:MAG TPA: hypothetical protein VMD03_07490 [Steroidobacteraceae bacterium]|nr:hypothetical protein [Steroidobacteraceae bacterium]
MKRNRSRASHGVLAAALLIAGCQISSPIISNGDNSYSLGSRTSVCMRCASASTALQQASDFCAKMGKSLVVKSPSGYMSPFGYNGTHQLVFSCLDQSNGAGLPPSAGNGAIFIDPTHPP